MKETKNLSIYDLTRKCGEIYKMVSLQQQISRGCDKRSNLHQLYRNISPATFLKKKCCMAMKYELVSRFRRKKTKTFVLNHFQALIDLCLLNTLY